MATQTEATAHAHRLDFEMENPREILDDITKYAITYAQNNPGPAALWCLGVGFLLGWKLKPW